MSASAPWSVKGIDPKAREIAKDLARRSGMTLGEWLNTMILEGDEEEGVVPLARRPHASDAVERRSRRRRLEDAYGEDDLSRVLASIDAIAERLEASERRSTLAISGVDQAVTGLVRRLDGVEQAHAAQGRRLDDIAEELREGHKRLRRFENDTGPRTAEGFQKVENAIGALAGRFYDSEERHRAGLMELRGRLDNFERGGGSLLTEVSARLDSAQARTSEALASLERSFASLDQRLRTAESRVEPEGAREAARFEKLAETLSRRVDENRAELMRRLDAAAAEGRVDKIERAVAQLGQQVQASERRSAKAVEAMGKEVLRIAQNLDQRMTRAEEHGDRRVAELGQELTRTLGQDMAKVAAAVEQRLVRDSDQHAKALEKLGGEISRISERLSDRIAQSERRAAQAIEDIGQRLAQASEKIEQGYDRSSGELAERMRQSEERTAQLLAEAREGMERRGTEPKAPAAQGDWRAAAFPDEQFDDPAGDWRDPALAPFPGAESEAAPPAPEPEAPFSTFGGADVAAVLEEIEAAEARTPPPAAQNQPFGQAAPVQPAAPPAPVEDDPFSAETDFVSPREMRAARPATTREAIEAARAAMAAPAAEASGGGLGLLRRGGKTRLQERLDKQAKRDGSTVRKAFLASVTAVALTGAVAGYMRLTDGAAMARGDEPRGDVDVAGEPLAAAALIADRHSPPDAEAMALYEQALEQLEAGDPAGVEPLTRAANLGLAAAQFHLAGLYAEGGPGLQPNPAEARLWLERAATAGEAPAMYNLAHYLLDGIGGPRSQAAAVRWFREAAERGLTDSQYNLARLHEDGVEGVPPDPAEAYKWYLVAAESGDAQAAEAAERLAPRLSASARRSAETAAERFTAQAVQAHG